MIDLEVQNRQEDHAYCRDLLRRFSLYTLCSVVVSVLLVMSAAYRIWHYPPQKTYLTTSEGELIPMQGLATADYRGVSDGEQ
jgi:hypothetical protein